MSRVTLGNIKDILLFLLLGVINSLIEIGHLYFRMLKISISVKYLYKFLKLKNPFYYHIGYFLFFLLRFNDFKCSHVNQQVNRKALLNTIEPPNET